jgi:Ca2+-binding RTX toxin-like protein
MGGAGAALLLGGGGRNLLIGGPGADTLNTGLPGLVARIGPTHEWH